MKDFGLVVIGAHFGVWLQNEISNYKDQNILLIEPVPYNYNILKKNYKDRKNILICTNAIFSENKNEWHHSIMTQKIYDDALKELDEE